MRGKLLIGTAAGMHPARYLQDILQVVDRIYAAACGEAPGNRRSPRCARSAFWAAAP
jgi:hypothetical protein